MIHSTVLLRTKSRRTIASSQYWTFQVPKGDISDFLTARKQLETVSKGRDDISLSVAGNKYYGREINPDLILVFIADIDENDRSVNEKISVAAEALREVLQYKNITFVKNNYEKLIAPLFIQN